MRQSHKTDALEHVRAGAGSASLSGDVSRGAAGRRGGRLQLALLPQRGRLPHQVHGGTRRCAFLVLFAELLHVAASLTERRLRRARRLRCGRARRPHRRRPRCAKRQRNSMFDVDVVPPPHTRHIRHPR